MIHEDKVFCLNMWVVGFKDKPLEFLEDLRFATVSHASWYAGLFQKQNWKYKFDWDVYSRIDIYEYVKGGCKYTKGAQLK